MVDVNDNSPAIPSMEPVFIAESKTGAAVRDLLPEPSYPVILCSFTDLPAGYMVAQVTANDVDLSSAITYSFSDNSSADVPFAIDRYSGVVTLTRALDYEEQTEYTLTVWASDSLHQTTGEVRVHVVDVNDNAPSFSQVSYQVYRQTEADAGGVLRCILRHRSSGHAPCLSLRWSCRSWSRPTLWSCRCLQLTETRAPMASSATDCSRLLYKAFTLSQTTVRT